MAPYPARPGAHLEILDLTRQRSALCAAIHEFRSSTGSTR